MSLPKLTINPCPSRLNMRKIIEEEEDDNFVFSIREEIIENTLCQIDKKVQEEDALNLIVDCSIEAMKKVIALNFYWHFGTADLGRGPWKVDEAISPSPPDAWAVGKVPVKKKSTVILEKQESITGSRSCTCDLGVECLCLKTPAERIAKLFKEFNRDKLKKKMQKSTSDLTPSKSESYDESGTTDESTSNVESLLSKEVAPKTKKKKRQKRAQTQTDEDSDIIDFKLPQIGLSDHSEIQRGPPPLDIELPPIRVNATFQCIPLEVPPKKKTPRRKRDRKR